MDAARRTLAVVGWHARGFRRMWRGSLTVSFLNPIFFLLSIGLLLGKLVDRSSPDAGGLTYLEFVAPALLATTMQTAASETTFPVKAGLKWLQTYHIVVSTPVRVGSDSSRASSPGPTSGSWSRCRSSRWSPGPAAHSSHLAALAPLAALLCGLAFGAVLAAITSTVEGDDWLAAIFRFGLVPLFLFSGTFFPVEQLPDWVEPIAWATPLWHGVELCRDLTSGQVEALPTVVHVVYLVVVTALGAVLAVRAQRGKLQR